MSDFLEQKALETTTGNVRAQPLEALQWLVWWGSQKISYLACEWVEKLI